MIGKPKIEERAAQPYVGIRTQVPIRKFRTVIPRLLDEVFTWLKERNIAPDGPPFMRHHVINMEALMDIALAVPVAEAIEGDDRVVGGELPAGRYAALIYTGVKNGIKGNGALLEWGAQQGLQWDRWDDESGEAFGARIEWFLTDPDNEPDDTKWETEVAIRLAEG